MSESPSVRSIISRIGAIRRLNREAGYFGRFIWEVKQNSSLFLESPVLFSLGPLYTLDTENLRSILGALDITLEEFYKVISRSPSALKWYVSSLPRIQSSRRLDEGPLRVPCLEPFIARNEALSILYIERTCFWFPLSHGVFCHSDVSCRELGRAFYRAKVRSLAEITSKIPKDGRLRPVEPFLLPLPPHSVSSYYENTRNPDRAASISEFPSFLLEKIASSPGPALTFASMVIKDRFPLAEPVIAESSGYVAAYLTDVLRGRRFKLGEPALIEEGDFASYVQYLSCCETDTSSSSSNRDNPISSTINQKGPKNWSFLKLSMPVPPLCRISSGDPPDTDFPISSLYPLSERKDSLVLLYKISKLLLSSSWSREQVMSIIRAPVSRISRAPVVETFLFWVPEVNILDVYVDEVLERLGVRGCSILKVAKSVDSNSDLIELTSQKVSLSILVRNTIYSRVGLPSPDRYVYYSPLPHFLSDYLRRGGKDPLVYSTFHLSLPMTVYVRSGPRPLSRPLLERIRDRLPKFSPYADYIGRLYALSDLGMHSLWCAGYFEDLPEEPSTIPSLEFSRYYSIDP